MIDIFKIEQLSKDVYCLSYIMKLLADNTFNNKCVNGTEFIYIFSSYLYDASENCTMNLQKMKINNVYYNIKPCVISGVRSHY